MTRTGLEKPQDELLVLVIGAGGEQNELTLVHGLSLLTL
jgi:hypothetical protein